MWIQRILSACLLVAIAISAAAFERPFPAVAKRGKLTMGAYPEVVIDGKVRRLSAGSRIYNEQNLIQMPVTIGSNRMTVNYTQDPQGEIDRVWILTEKEAMQSPAEQKINQVQ